MTGILIRESRGRFETQRPGDTKGKSCESMGRDWTDTFTC